MTLPTVHVYVLGGTITMAAGSGGGIAPKLTGDDLIAQVPGLDKVARLGVKTPFLKPGASLTFKEVAEVAALIAADSADGYVVVQGTDTIDETSYLLDLLHQGSEPVVVTGAMRGASALSADGPANLMAAIHTAANPDAANRGVLVVLNDEIHNARDVEKMNKGLVQAFQSLNRGPAGFYLESQARFLRLPDNRQALGLQPECFGRVAIIKAALDVDDALLRATPDLGYDGVVLEATGAGHVPGQLLDALDGVMNRIPLVLASRVPGGPIFQNTYGFPGSEMDMIRRGAIPAGWLSAHKARLLLAVALGSGFSAAQLRQVFERAAIAP